MTDAKPIMAGKKGLIMGVANDRSIAWGIAKAVHAQGASLAFTYQGDAFGRRAIGRHDLLMLFRAFTVLSGRRHEGGKLLFSRCRIDAAPGKLQAPQHQGTYNETVQYLHNSDSSRPASF